MGRKCRSRYDGQLNFHQHRDREKVVFCLWFEGFIRRVLFLGPINEKAVLTCQNHAGILPGANTNLSRQQAVPPVGFHEVGPEDAHHRCLLISSSFQFWVTFSSLKIGEAGFASAALSFGVQTEETPRVTMGMANVTLQAVTSPHHIPSGCSFCCILHGSQCVERFHAAL